MKTFVFWLHFCIVALCAFSCSITHKVKEEPLVGHWQGECKFGNTSIEFAIDFIKEDRGYTATYSSDDQRALHIPFQNVQVSGDSVHFELRGDIDSWIFNGKLNNERISGLIRKGTRSEWFSVSKKELSPVNYASSEIEFNNDTVKLSGTLRLPDSKIKVPAIVFMHGSGAEQRFASAYMADFFAKRGIATLIFDKRGTGKSKGNWLKSSFEDLANDAIAGVKYLQSNPLILPHQIGIYGHSQGGSICPMVLNRYPEISFGISSASAGVSMVESDWYEVQNRFKNYVSGTSYENAMKVMKRYLQFASTGTGYDELITEANKFKSEQWYQNYIGNIDTAAPFFQYYRKIGKYNPVEQWKKVKQPCLVLKGDSDKTSPGYPTFQNIEDALKFANNYKYKIVIFQNTTHEMQLASSAGDFWFRATPNYCDTIYNWIGTIITQK